jgi:BirA family transcriptional regulator, biotin operon repressor / biotin---[acetyl-CoA-carboxylase] ligase
MGENEPTYRRVLDALKDQPSTHISGSLLASCLHLTRTAVWKHIRTLKSMGYGIQAHPKKGYILTDVPDLLIPEEISPALRTTWIGRTYLHYRETGSTNDQALSQAALGAPHGTVIVAEQQTAGRGRLRRSWVSSPHCGIYMSILLRAPLPVRDAPQSTLVAALSLVKVLRELYHLQAAVKWPNDVLIQDKKVAGILTEMQSDQEFTRFLVIGIGINVNHTKDELNEPQAPFRYPATSVAIELADRVRRRDLLLGYLHQFERDFERFLASGFAVLVPEFEDASATLGRNVIVQCGNSVYSGKATGLTPEGALRLLTEDGREEIVWAGDVSMLKREP